MNCYQIKKRQIVGLCYILTMLISQASVLLLLNHQIRIFFFILLYHSHFINLTVYLDTGTGKHRRIINVTELGKTLKIDYCNALLGFYVFSGEDCTSAFKGKGKVTPLKKLQKHPKYFHTFRLVNICNYL